ncbi:MAG TPA: trypsin-like peptidase domain-containing protein [Isosphaeraceae bacterium]|nr:trypsin-like peptidase domain-containing protein [Isosphaeraceae bacterium]
MPTIDLNSQFGHEPITDVSGPWAVAVVIRSGILPFRRRFLVLAFGIVLLGPRAACPDEKATAADVIRPTVQLRNGTNRGSGTILASVPDETLILTAAHVIHNASALQVEIHRFNLGPSKTSLSEGGGWPRLVPATVVAADPAADVAVVRITGMVALPYVARFDLGADEPAPGEVLSSVGIDRTLFLTRWRTTVEGTALVDIKRGGGPRRFIVTTRYPEHGRSGGGLYRGDGAVVGVCVGQLNLHKGQPKVGLFASVESIRRLLREHGLEGLMRPTPPGASPAPQKKKARS